MSIPMQITSRGIELSDEMQRRLQRRADALGRLRSDILWCKVVVSVPHRRHRRGRRFRVHLAVALSDSVLVSDRRSAAGPAEDDLESAVSHAFRAIKHQLSAPRRLSGTRCRRKGERPWAADRSTPARGRDRRRREDWSPEHAVP